jgi:hypothetical protein
VTRRTLHLALWALVTALVVLTGRSLAYLLAPHPTAESIRLGHLAGGPRLVVVALVAVGGALVLAGGALVVATAAVRQRHLVCGGVRPPRPTTAGVVARTLALSVVSCAVFGVVESHIHARHGLHMSAIQCLSGPMHRNALAILAALSLVAVAFVAATGHVLRWLRRAIEALRRPRRPLPAAPVHGERLVDGLVAAVARLALGSRAPPLPSR